MRPTPVLAVALLVSLTACSDKESPSPADGASPSQASEQADDDAQPRERGSVAVWALASDSDITADSKEFTAAVTRLGCNGGVTGRVLAPQVETTETRVTISFEAESVGPGAFTCPSNDYVPYLVVLDEAIGNRELVDGQCAEGQEAATTSLCRDAGVRWPSAPE